ncbi:MAG: hypothetical protein ABI611_20440 [Solirubrobacteraceae bacterium]
MRADEQQFRLAAVGDACLELGGELLADRDRAAAVTRLGRGELPADDRATDIDLRRVEVEVGVHDAQHDRLGDRRPIKASSSKHGRHRSGISVSRAASWWRVRKRRSSNS